jgi:hypothetical protein
MTPKALCYEGQRYLQNRFLNVGEQAGIAKGDGQAMLRQLLSEGRIVHKSVTFQQGIRVTEKAYR